MKTDEQVQLDVLAELQRDPSIDAGKIGVEVKEGVVTLTGRVNTYMEKWDAERVAQGVSGVVAMSIDIEVVLAGTTKRDDVDIARAAETALRWMTYWPIESVKVTVEGGRVTLAGSVNWEFQRQAIEGAVRHLLGVTGVSNQIVLKPQVTSGVVKSDIEAALNRRAWADAKNITVDVRDDEVTLTGFVQSWSERQVAKEAAWSTPGVRSVVDNLVVAN